MACVGNKERCFKTAGHFKRQEVFFATSNTAYSIRLK